MPSPLSSAKRNCKLCHTYRRLHPEVDYRTGTLEALESLCGQYRELYNRARMDDGASTALVAAIFEKKQKCLDAINACNSCTREADRANRMLPASDPLLEEK